jgi:hypothetical protein
VGDNSHGLDIGANHHKVQNHGNVFDRRNKEEGGSQGHDEQHTKGSDNKAHGGHLPERRHRLCSEMQNFSQSGQKGGNTLRM